MKFPVTIRHRRAEAVIYAKSESYPYYRMVYRAAGKRILRSFSTCSEARKEAEAKVRELATGNQSVALSAKEAADALAIRDALDAFRLDWRDAFGIPRHVEVSTAKSKTRQRRLVDICPALEQWLGPYRSTEGKIAAQWQGLSGYGQAQ
jgi:hypothetical protein